MTSLKVTWTSQSLALFHLGYGRYGHGTSLKIHSFSWVKSASSTYFRVYLVVENGGILNWILHPNNKKRCLSVRRLSRLITPDPLDRFWRNFLCVMDTHWEWQNAKKITILRKKFFDFADFFFSIFFDMCPPYNCGSPRLILLKLSMRNLGMTKTRFFRFRGVGRA